MGNKNDYDYNKMIEALGGATPKEHNQLLMNKPDDWVRSISKQIANKMNIPYCWEDIEYRLKNGIKLPFKLRNN